MQTYSELRPVALPNAVRAPGRNGSWDARLSVYNWKATNTRKLSRDLGVARVTSAPTINPKWMLLGDSMSTGHDSTRGWPDSWPEQFKSALENIGVYVRNETIYIGNTVGANATAPQDPRVTTTGTWATGSNGGFADGQTAGCTYSITTARKCTAFTIWYYNNSSAFSVSVDGATAVVVTPTGANTLGTYTVSNLSENYHTIVITRTGASNIYIGAFSAYTNDREGISFYNTARVGRASIDDINTGYAQPGWLHYNTIPDPSVLYIMFGGNDFFGGLTPAQFKTNMTTLINNWRAVPAVPDIVLMISASPADGTNAAGATWDQFASTVYDLADQYDLPVIDLYNLSGLHNNLNGLGILSFDGTHLNTQGLTMTAQAIQSAILGEADTRKATAGRAPKFAELMVFGHSYAQLTTTGVSRLGQRWSTKFASSIGAREVNLGINGSKIMLPDAGIESGGWNTIFHVLLKNRSIARAAGAGYPAENSIGALYWGANDWPRLGFTKLSTTTVFGNVLRACIARFRASRHLASNDASVVYATPANWTADTSLQYGANPAGTGEVAKKSTVAAPGNITITTPSDVEAGCYITVFFGIDPTSSAGSAAITWGGVSQGSVATGGASLFDNSATASGGAAVSANRHAITCKRIGPVVTPGTQSIVITMTGASPVTGHTFLGYDIEEADPPPLLVLNSPKITPGVGYNMWRLSPAWQGTTNQFPATDTGANSADALWDQGNQVIRDVCAEFDARVLYIDVDAALAKKSIYWPAGDAHPNDRGNTVIAGLCFDAIEKLVQTFTNQQIEEVNVDTVGGDSPADQFTTSGGKFGGVSVFGRSRSPKIYYPCAVGETPLSKTLVANTLLAFTGQYFVGVSDFTEFRIRAHVTTALANAKLFCEGQPVFGYNGLDGVATGTTPYGSLLLDATGMWVGAWSPLFPQYRRGEWQLRFCLLGSTAGTVSFTNAGIEFR